MQRMVGATLIVLGGTFYGFSMARALHARVRQLSAVIAALQQLESEIVFAHMPLPEALGRVARGSQGVVRQLFTLLAHRLHTPHALQVSTAWGEAIREWAQGAALEAQELTVLESLGSILGRTDAEDQVRALRYTMERLARIRTHLEETVERESRMRLYFGVAGGITLAVLLV